MSRRSSNKAAEMAAEMRRIVEHNRQLIAEGKAPLDMEKHVVEAAPRDASGTMKPKQKPTKPKPKRLDDRMLGVRLPDQLLQELDELIEERRAAGVRPYMRTRIVEEALRAYLKKAKRSRS
jgi:hypothetical protein